MTIETTVITTKAVCAVVKGALTALVAGLAQWATSGEGPGQLAWIVIISAAILGGTNGLDSFLSTAFGKYLDVQKNGNGTPKPEPPKP